jgi:hypothetical protein
MFDLRVDHNRDIEPRLLLGGASGKDLEVKIIIGFIADGKFEAAEADSIKGLGRRGRKIFGSGG